MDRPYTDAQLAIVHLWEQGARLIMSCFKSALPIILLAGLTCCSTIGRGFKSDPARLSRLVVGQTTSEEAVAILEGEPYIRQNLADGTIAWHWQRIAARAYVGITDNRLLVLQFKSPDDGKSWRFLRVMHAQNIELPPGMPFGSVAR